MNRNKKNTEQILENLGEYIQEEQAEYQDSQHVFSANYKRKKEILLEDVSPKKRLHMSRPAAAAVAVLVVAACSVTVYAAVKLLQTTVKFDEDRHHVSITNDVADDVYIPPIKITPEYLPEGYEEWEENKYSYQGEFGASGLTIIDASGTKSETYQDVSDCVTKELPNATAYIMNKKGYEYSHIVLLSFGEKGHTVAIYASSDISEDDLLKVCENITIAEVPEEDPDRTYKAFAYEAGEEEIGEEADLTVTQEQIVEMNQPFKELSAYTADYEELDVQARVTDVTVSDKADLSLLNENTVVDTEKISLLGSDGSLPDYTVLVNEWNDEAGELEQRDAGTFTVKYVEVTAELENLSDKDSPDVNVQPVFCNLKDNGDGTYELQYGEEQKVEGLGDGFRGCEPYELSIDHFPFYFDSSAYPGDSHFYNTDLKAGEKKTVHLGFAIPEQWLDDLYLGYDGSTFVKLNWTEE